MMFILRLVQQYLYGSTVSAGFGQAYKARTTSQRSKQTTRPFLAGSWHSVKGFCKCDVGMFTTEVYATSLYHYRALCLFSVISWSRISLSATAGWREFGLAYQKEISQVVR